MAKNNNKKEKLPKNKKNTDLTIVTDQNLQVQDKLFLQSTMIIITIIAIIAVLCCTILGILNIFNQRIIFNVKVANIDVSNLTVDTAKSKLEKELNERLTTDMGFTHNNENYTIVPSDLTANYHIDDLIKEAYLIGRNNNIFKNNFEILSTWIHGKTITPKATIDMNLLDSVIPQIESTFKDGVIEPSYEIDSNKLIIYNGKDGNKINKEEFAKEIENHLNQIDFKNEIMQLPVSLMKKSPIDLDGLYKEIYKKPVDAYFTKNPFKVYPSSNGLDFKIPLDEAKNMLKEDKEEYVIPLKVLHPKVSTSDIGTEAFPNLLSSYSTSYGSSNYSRATNVTLATRKINGTVLMPGETFSYNQVVGKRTASAGYKEAYVYVNGQVATDIGGGICQVSSTLYNAVLRANLEIVSRSNHHFQVGYVPIGTDATVSWGAPDLKFKNNRSYPIKIVTSTKGKVCRMKIYGLKEANDYDVEIVSKRTGSVPFKTTYITDRSLPKGTEKVVSRGSNGAKSETYKILKKDGKVISRKRISSDYYHPHNRVIRRNT